MRLFVTWALGAPFLLFLAACAAQPDRATDEARTAHVISAALQNIEDVYYRETEASALVATGLTQITETYPEIRFAQDGDKIVASVSGEAVYSFNPGADHGATELWSERLSITLNRIADASPADGPSLNTLTNTFVDGVVESLDERSRYATPEAARANRELYERRLGTLDIGLEDHDAGLRVTAVYSIPLFESRALLRDDIIVGIDGISLASLTDEKRRELLRGPIDSTIVLSVVRGVQTTPLTITLKREVVAVKSAAVYGEGDIRRIQLTRLHTSTLPELRKQLNDISNSLPSGDVGIILDLRNNPGGLVETTIGIADIFLSHGQIFSTQGRHRDSRQYFRAKGEVPVKEQPLVVLVNTLSISGAEIVAAALQDNGRAVAVGEISYGLGTIQTVLPLPNRGALILTWTEISTPAGYRLDKRGVMPTVCTGGNVTADQVIASLRNGTGGVIDKATRTRDIDPDDTPAIEAFRALCPPRSDDADVSLEVAQALLADPDLYTKVLKAASR